MDKPSRPWLALLISVLAHAAAALVLAGQANRLASHGGAQQGAAARPPLLVRLLPSGAPPARAVLADSADVPDSKPAAAEPQRPAPPATGRMTVADGETKTSEAERHYFGPEVMTAQPQVAQGMIVGKILVVPGITPQTVHLRVWISDEGAVERVALETPMPEDEERMLLAAFTSVRFHPGRIGRIAVRGHLAMEVMLDYAVRM